jgi:tight adherence protein B
MSTFILVATALACLALAEVIYYLIRYTGERQRTDLRRRLRAMRDEAVTSLMRERRVARGPELDRLMRALPFVERLEQLLLQTDLEWTVASMLGFGLLLGTVLMGGLALLMRGSLAFAWPAIPVGVALPVLFAVVSRARRSTKFSSQLPEALDMMVRSLRAGHGLNAAFKLVATEMPLPVAVEFARCFEEHNIGVDFRGAVENMTMRVPNNLDLKIFAVSVVLQHETGGNLVEILEQIAHTIRERYKFYGKVDALTAEGRISGLILAVLPFVTTLLIGMSNPDYISVLFKDSLGPYFIATGILLWVSGVAWMARLTRVDY